MSRGKQPAKLKSWWKICQLFSNNNYLLDIKGTVEMEEIPQDLILNWDQTAIYYVPVSSWTMAKEGCKKFQLLVLTIRDRSRLYLLQQ